MHFQISIGIDRNIHYLSFFFWFVTNSGNLHCYCITGRSEESAGGTDKISGKSVTSCNFLMERDIHILDHIV